MSSNDDKKRELERNLEKLREIYEKADDKAA